MSSLHHFFDQTSDGLELPPEQDPFAQEQPFQFPLHAPTLPTTNSANPSPRSKPQPTHQAALQPTEYEPSFIRVDQPTNYHRTYILQSSSALDRQSDQLQKLNENLQRRNDSQSREIAVLKRSISAQTKACKAHLELLQSEILKLRKDIEIQAESHKMETQKTETAITRLTEGLTAFSNFVQERWE